MDMLEKWVFLGAVICFWHFVELSYGQPSCNNFLLDDVCEAYLRWNKCNYPEAQISCRKTCRVCFPGWTEWSSYSSCNQTCQGHQVRSRICQSIPANCPGNDFQTQPCNTNCAVSAGVTAAPSSANTTTSSVATVIDDFDTRAALALVLPEGPSAGARIGPDGVRISTILCNSTHFKCNDETLPQTCVRLDQICDGFQDCPNFADENQTYCFASAYLGNAFEIKNNLQQVCLEVITTDPAGPVHTARAYRRCPSAVNPQRSIFLWRWWNENHLLNVYTGRCLETFNPATSITPRLIAAACDAGQINQKFVCDDANSRFLKIRLQYPYEGVDEHFLSLGARNIGWPVVLQRDDDNLNKLWRRGISGFPTTICNGNQFYLSMWSAWSRCSATCSGGTQTRTRICVNAGNCTGSRVEGLPCNAAISCTNVLGNGSRNSFCPNNWTMIDSAYRYLSSESTDPACFQLINQPLSYDNARARCESMQASLASIKHPTATQALIKLMADAGIIGQAYVGVEEDFSLLPISGHHLRYNFDSTPVGSYTEWSMDCVIGAGYDYNGRRSVTASGLSCQRWNSNIPHRVRVLPIGNTQHNFCRNPDFDPRGPWCYTISPTQERDYCMIPQCLDTTNITQLSSLSEFRLALPCSRSTSLGEVHYSYLHATGTYLLLGTCSPMQTQPWANYRNSSKFVWDASRSRIISLVDKKCLEATSLEHNARVTLADCDHRRVTQRWMETDGKLALATSLYTADLFLDVSPTPTFASISSTEHSAWTATRLGGFPDDLAALRGAHGGVSFVMRSVSDGRCLGVNPTGNNGKLTSSGFSVQRSLTLLPCERAAHLQWSVELTAQSRFFHFYSSLCMLPSGSTPGSAVMLRICGLGSSSVEWGCDSERRVYFGSGRRLYLNVDGDRVVSDDAGTVFVQTCDENNLESNEVWRFTDSSTLLMHHPTRRCLSVPSVRPGVGLFTFPCNAMNNQQHWSFTSQRISSRGQRNTWPYYSIRLAFDSRLQISIDSSSGVVMLRDGSALSWVAFNRYSRLSSVKGMADCYFRGVNSSVFYAGNVSTTMSGRACTFWTAEEIRNNSELIENYCRYPFQMTSQRPWCYIRDLQGRRVPEDCLVPLCPTRKISIDRTGMWQSSNGEELLPFICQIEPHCYRGTGESYTGIYATTASGPCIPWANSGSPYIDLLQNYCRNPTGAVAGPWCYVSVGGTPTITTCNLPVCRNISYALDEALINATPARVTYSSASYGLTTGATLTSQCIRGHVASGRVTRLTSTVVMGQLRPPPIACSRRQCPPIEARVSNAVLTSSRRFYREHSVFTCRAGFLAGPSMPIFRFVCNEYGSWEPERPHSPPICTPACNPGWIDFRSHCYRVHDVLSTFNEALSSCRRMGGSLADLDDEVALNFLTDLISSQRRSGSLYWLGIRQRSHAKSNPASRQWRSVNTNDKLGGEGRGANYTPIMRNTFLIMHYLHNRYTHEFDEILPYNLRCMYVDDRTLHVASRGCYDYPRRRMLWAWISPHHLYNIATGKCLTGFPVEGFSSNDLQLQAMVQDCDVNNPMQFVGCRRYERHASLKLLFYRSSFFVDSVHDSWDRIQMGGGFYAGNFSQWVLNTSDYDICHHSVAYKGNAYLLWQGPVANGSSYTYDEAMDRCASDGGELATETQLLEKMNSDDISSCACAWGRGNIAYSVMRVPDPFCPSSLPIGGVKRCAPTPTRADAWCFKGVSRSLGDVPLALALWFRSDDKVGVQERDENDMARSVCRVTSRWRCPEPLDLFQGSRVERIHPSYSYLGRTVYECAPGTWFDRDVFTRRLFCSADLQWEPRNDSRVCSAVICSSPPTVASATSKVNGYMFGDRTTYTCSSGYWFAPFLFSTDLFCSAQGRWLHPTLTNPVCGPINCQTPLSLRNARMVSLPGGVGGAATLQCDPGYWFSGGQNSFQLVCNASGMWQPDPNTLKCWKVYCPPPDEHPSFVWRPIDERTTALTCAPGYELREQNPIFGTFRIRPTEIVFRCGSSGNWSPDQASYLCTPAPCPPLPTVPSASFDERNASDYGTMLTYHCYPGYHVNRMFALYSKFHDQCLYRGTDDFVYASKSSCGTPDMLYFHWERPSGPHELISLVEPRSGLCLSAASSSSNPQRSIPRRSNFKINMRLETCVLNSSRQSWFCNLHDVSELLFGLRLDAEELFLIIDLSTNMLQTTTDKLEGTEFVSYTDRNPPSEFPLCRHRQPNFEQPVLCTADSKWLPDPTDIQCIPLFCPTPPTLQFADVSLTDDQLPYGSAATYQCYDGYEYLPGRSAFVSRCSEGCTWVPNPLSLPCNKIHCPSYRIPQGSRISSGNLRDSSMGSTMVFECPPGSYFGDNIQSMTITCQPNRVWNQSATVTSCMPITCQEPPDVPHATVSFAPFPTYNSLARYMCRLGYTMSSGRKYLDTYCNEAGLWSPDPAQVACSRVECESPDVVPNTLRFDSAPGQGNFQYGSVIFYRCRAGTSFLAGITKRAVTCRDDGNWYPHPHSLHCVEMRCAAPTLPRNSRVIGDNFAFGGKLTLLCHPGYELRLVGEMVGRTTFECSKNRLWKPDPALYVCARVNCPPPPDVPGTRHTLADNLYTSLVQYQCQPGTWIFPGLLSGLTKCNVNGNWTPDPFTFTCSVLNCGPPGVYTFALPTSYNSTEYGAVATVQCQDGYWYDHNFEKFATVRCTQDGTWKPSPEVIKCTEVKCSEPGRIMYATRELLPPAIYQRVVSIDPVTGGVFYSFGVQLRYSCDESREFARNQRSIIVTCSGDGNWNVDVENMKCSPTTCPPPPSLLFAYTSVNTAVTSLTYYVGARVRYTCEVGYWFRRGITTMLATCDNDGRWNSTMNIICLRVSCPQPPLIVRGKVVASSWTYAHTARYSCDRGYKLNVDTESSCTTSGVWSPDPATFACDPVTCPPPPPIGNAQVVRRPVELIYQSRAEYLCDNGFYFYTNVNRTNLICEENGQWSGENMRCIALNQIECSFPPYVTNAHYVSQTSRSVRLKCDRGYGFNSSLGFLTEQLRTCDDEGNWIPDPVTCEKLNCSLPTVSGAFPSSTQPAFQIGDILMLTCAGSTVFQLPFPSGEFNRTIAITCTSTTQWIPDVGTLRCESVQCSRPPMLRMARLTFRSRAFGALALYRCLRSTSIAGQVVRRVICSLDGRWNPDPSNWECVVSRCPLPTPPDDAVLSVMGTEHLRLDSIHLPQLLRVTCNNGYALENSLNNGASREYTCKSGSQWSPSDPADAKCKVIFCNGLPNLALQPFLSIGVAATSGQFQYGTALVYRCPRGSWFSAPSLEQIEVRCLGNGTWQPDPSRFRCVPVTCGEPPPQPFATLRAVKRVMVTSSTLGLGSSWRYSCNPGYRINLQETEALTVCDEGGQWSPAPSLLTCRNMPCDELPALPNTINSLLVSPFNDDNRFHEGDSFTYICEEGFWVSNSTSKNASFTLTCSAGRWKPIPPAAVRCVPLVCDAIRPVVGARSDGTDLVYGSRVTYTCASGQFFPRIRSRQTEMRCGAEGRWDPDPESLVCVDVICEDIRVEGATASSNARRMDATIFFNCRRGAWFNRNVTQLATTCDENGKWIPDISGRKCVAINCGEPPVKNALLVTSNFSLHVRITLECLAGYRLVPTPPVPPVVTCEIPGNWVPDPSVYKCQGAECPLPAAISRATIENEGSNTFGESVLIVCNPGFIIRPGTTSVRATCGRDGAWDIDIRSVFCRTFQCEFPKSLSFSTHSDVGMVTSPRYGSMVEYRCDEGYSFAAGETRRRVRCTETGLWDPPINFKCAAIKCSSPSSKRNGEFDSREVRNFDIGDDLSFQCVNFSWLSAQYVATEWAFTGLLGVRMLCQEDGVWLPHPDSFACRPIQEGPFPTGYDRGLTVQQIKRQMWLQDKNYVTRELMTNPYFIIVETGDAVWTGGAALSSSVILEGSASSSGAQLAWDGDLTTSWVPNMTEDGIYNVTVYLGELYLVQAIEIFAAPEQTIGFTAHFSPNGQWFNQSVTSGNLADSSRDSVKNFSYPAKFVQIFVTRTDNVPSPPSISEIRMLLKPALYHLDLPIDYLTFMIYFIIWLSCFIIIALFAHGSDKLDRFRIQFVPFCEGDRSSHGNVCYVVKLTLSHCKCVKYLLLRLLSTTSSPSPLVLIDSPLRSKRIVVVIPSENLDPLALQVGYLDHGRLARLKDELTMKAKVKIGVVGCANVFSARLPWLHSIDIPLHSSTPNIIHLHDEPHSFLLEAVKAKIRRLSSFQWTIYNSLCDHLLPTLFVKDFVTQTTRFDRLVVTSIGLFTSLCSATIFSFATSTLTCFGVGTVSCLPGLMAMAVSMGLLLKQPLYGQNRPHDPYVHNAKLISDVQKLYASKHQLYLDDKDDDDGARLARLMKSFLAVDIGRLQRHTSSYHHDIDDISDSNLLPMNYRHPKPIVDDISDDDVSICTLDLDAGYKRRRSGVRRRTRSAPALLQYKPRKRVGDNVGIERGVATELEGYRVAYPDQHVGTEPGEYRVAVPDRRTVHRRRSSISLPSLSFHSVERLDEDVLSCASLFSEMSLVRAWHDLHTSLQQPIENLFLSVNRQVTKKKLHDFSWSDPNYRRIPSEYLIRGYRLGDRLGPIAEQMNVELRKTRGLARRISSSTLSFEPFETETAIQPLTLYPFAGNKPTVTERKASKSPHVHTDVDLQKLGEELSGLGRLTQKLVPFRKRFRRKNLRAKPQKSNLKDGQEISVTVEQDLKATPNIEQDAAKQLEGSKSIPSALKIKDSKSIPSALKIQDSKSITGALKVTDSKSSARTLKFEVDDVEPSFQAGDSSKSVDSKAVEAEQRSLSAQRSDLKRRGDQSQDQIDVDSRMHLDDHNYQPHRDRYGQQDDPDDYRSGFRDDKDDRYVSPDYRDDNRFELRKYQDDNRYGLARYRGPVDDRYKKFYQRDGHDSLDRDQRERRDSLDYDQRERRDSLNIKRDRDKELDGLYQEARLNVEDEIKVDEDRIHNLQTPAAEGKADLDGLYAHAPTQPASYTEIRFSVPSLPTQSKSSDQVKQVDLPSKTASLKLPVPTKQSASKESSQRSLRWEDLETHTSRGQTADQRAQTELKQKKLAGIIRPEKSKSVDRKSLIADVKSKLILLQALKKLKEANEKAEKQEKNSKENNEKAEKQEKKSKENIEEAEKPEKSSEEYSEKAEQAEKNLEKADENAEKPGKKLKEADKKAQKELKKAQKELEKANKKAQKELKKANEKAEKPEKKFKRENVKTNKPEKSSKAADKQAVKPEKSPDPRRRRRRHHRRRGGDGKPSRRSEVESRRGERKGRSGTPRPRSGMKSPEHSSITIWMRKKLGRKSEKQSGQQNTSVNNEVEKLYADEESGAEDSDLGGNEDAWRKRCLVSPRQHPMTANRFENLSCRKKESSLRTKSGANTNHESNNRISYSLKRDFSIPKRKWSRKTPLYSPSTDQFLDVSSSNNRCDVVRDDAEQLLRNRSVQGRRWQSENCLTPSAGAIRNNQYSKCRNSLLGDDNNWDYDESEKSRAAACRLKPAKWVDMDDAASETLADVLKTNKKGSIDSFHSATSVDTWADGEGRRRPIMVDRTPLLISHSADDLYQVSPHRSRTIKQLVSFLFALVCLLAALCIRTIDHSATILCVLQYASLAFFTMALLLEILFRRLVFWRNERLSVERLYPDLCRKTKSTLNQRS